MRLRSGRASCDDGLDPRKTVYQEISQGAETMRMGDRDVNVRAYVSTFNLKVRVRVRVRVRASY